MYTPIILSNVIKKTYPQLSFVILFNRSNLILDRFITELEQDVMLSLTGLTLSKLAIINNFIKNINKLLIVHKIIIFCITTLTFLAYFVLEHPRVFVSPKKVIRKN